MQVGAEGKSGAMVPVFSKVLQYSNPLYLFSAIKDTADMRVLTH